jgi:Tfp pilus assembly protein PilV
MIIYHKNRAGFSMITAISMIVLMSTVALFITSLSSKLLKETVTQYQREQAVLLANSYTEYAIMAVTANERTVNCLQTINGNFGDFNADIKISYIGTADEISNCNNKLATLSEGHVSPLNVIIDTYIRYPDLDSPNANMLTYHRRTLQKI